MKKSAAPSFIKMWDKLSPTARDVITKSLPSSYTRQLGKKPLGTGSEGSVFPSVTGSVGDSAIKYFPTMRGQTIMFPLGNLYAPERGLAMRQRPDVFPRIFGINQRGFAMERLTDLSKNALEDLHTISTQIPWRRSRALHKVSIYKRLRDIGDPQLVQKASNPRELIRLHLKELGPFSTLKTVAERRAMLDVYTKLGDTYKEGFATRPKDNLKLLTPEGRKFRRMQSKTPWNSDSSSNLGEPKLTHPVGGKPITLSDVAIHHFPSVNAGGDYEIVPQNIMQGSDGRIVYSDPIFYNAR